MRSTSATSLAGRAAEGRGGVSTLGTPIVAGREFVDADRAGTTPVVVVNEAFVRKFVHQSNPLGQVVRIGIVGPNVGSAEVVGVAGDAVYSSLREPAPPTVYSHWPNCKVSLRRR